MDPPSGRVPEQGPDWFLVATEACGGGTPDLGFFSGVSVFIEIFGVGLMLRWASRGPLPTRARQGGLARPGALWPPGSPPLVVLFSNIYYIFQNNSP